MGKFYNYYHPTELKTVIQLLDLDNHYIQVKEMLMIKNWLDVMNY